MVDEKTRFSESDGFVNDVIPLNPLVQLTKLISVLLSYVITSSFIFINPKLSGKPWVFDTKIVSVDIPAYFVVDVDFIRFPFSLNLI